MKSRSPNGASATAEVIETGALKELADKGMAPE